jgi:sugar fermentation stimulation protein A
MQFPDPLIPGTLIKRYKRFLADITLENGEMVTAHCANSGSMMGLKEPGSQVWLSPARNPNRKLKYTWELVAADGALVGINTSHPNTLVEEAVKAGKISELSGYASVRREVKYGRNSRIDLLLEGGLPVGDSAPICYVEVKNVTLKRGKRDGLGLAEFPDAVTARGAKHLEELGDMVEAGHRAVMVYLVQRGDCGLFDVAGDIDPAYDEQLQRARSRGVEAICYSCHVTPQNIEVTHPLPLALG